METRTTDAYGRLNLPSGFANATVVIELVSNTEGRSWRAQVIPENDTRFPEESVTPLSDRDRDRFLDSLDNPPAPNEALHRAFKKHSQTGG